MAGMARWHNGKTLCKKSPRLAPAIMHPPRRISILQRGMTHETAFGSAAPPALQHRPAGRLRCSQSPTLSVSGSFSRRLRLDHEAEEARAQTLLRIHLRLLPPANHEGQ